MCKNTRGPASEKSDAKNRHERVRTRARGASAVGTINPCTDEQILKGLRNSLKRKTVIHIHIRWFFIASLSFSRCFLDESPLRSGVIPHEWRCQAPPSNMLQSCSRVGCQVGMRGRWEWRAAGLQVRARLHYYEGVRGGLAARVSGSRRVAPLGVVNLES